MKTIFKVGDMITLSKSIEETYLRNKVAIVSKVMDLRSLTEFHDYEYEVFLQEMQQYIFIDEEEIGKLVV